MLSHGVLVVLAFLVGFVFFAALIARLPLIVQALDYGFRELELLVVADKEFSHGKHCNRLAHDIRYDVA